MPNAIIPANLAIKAMRDSGYKTTAHAIAELIDNSVQAGADSIEVICIEEQRQSAERTTIQITEIGILDNGCGMSEKKLSDALQFGNGTHLDDRTGIGRFGIGLPNSSISQCQRVEVWTWESGIDNALYSYLDVDEIVNENLSVVPKPIKKEVPQKFISNAKKIGKSGTLVRWSGFRENRQTWKQAKTTFRHTEFLIGRMYRKFIQSGEINIRMLAITEENKSYDELVEVNDPLYLTAKSSTPEPFRNKPMFEQWGEKTFPIKHNEEHSEVIVRISVAHEETITEGNKNRGSTKFGTHAGKNIGVSIIREKRELDLDRGWARSYDPTERWWGVEVEFPSKLDEVFGVTNNKQSATIFSQLSNFNWSDEADVGEAYPDLIKRLENLGDQRAKLIPIVTYIRDSLKEVRKLIKKQRVGSRIKESSSANSMIEDVATKKFKERADEGHIIDTDNVIPTVEYEKDIEETLMSDIQVGEKNAKIIAEIIVQRKQKVKFFTTSRDNNAFFEVRNIQGGVTIIEFNIKHPLYEQLIESIDPTTLDENENEYSDDDYTRLLEQIVKASDTLKLLFASWARYELEDVGKEYLLNKIRQDWGEMAKIFLTDRDYDDQ